VARLECKVSDDAPVDDDPKLLNFAAMVSRIGCWMSFLPQKNWPNLGKSDSLASETRWSAFCDP
jgi:hypothetical protein